MKVIVLGQVFTSTSHPQLQKLTKSLPWITYRSSLPIALEGGLKSDSGWGCMIRSAQMLIATGFLLSFGLPIHNDVYDSPELFPIFAKTISLFFDHKQYPFSLHRISELGAKHGTPVGQWFGPNTISHTFHSLINEYEDTPASCYLANDSTIYESQIQPYFQKDKPVLILVPIRLGVDALNPVYHEHIKDIFHFPHCVGIAGGKPNSAYYFVGMDGEKLLYLDPHYTRAVIEFKEPSQYTPEDLSSYSCSSLSSINIQSVDPSMVLGFLCSNKADYEAFKCLSMDSVTTGPTPLFNFEDAPQSFDGHVDIISDFEEEENS